MKLYTIGFTKKSAETFFETLKANDVRTVLDIRLKNNTQFAGFTKRDDLPYLLQKIGGIGYRHWIEAAPTADLLKRYQDEEITWGTYKKEYNRLIKARNVAEGVTAAELDRACLLCAEPTAERCHRRLLAEHLAAKFPKITIVHL